MTTTAVPCSHKKCTSAMTATHGQASKLAWQDAWSLRWHSMPVYLPNRSCHKAWPNGRLCRMHQALTKASSHYFSNRIMLRIQTPLPVLAMYNIEVCVCVPNGDNWAQVQAAMYVSKLVQASSVVIPNIPSTVICMISHNHEISWGLSRLCLSGCKCNLNSHGTPTSWTVANGVLYPWWFKLLTALPVW